MKRKYAPPAYELVVFNFTDQIAASPACEGRYENTWTIAIPAECQEEYLGHVWVGGPSGP